MQWGEKDEGLYVGQWKGGAAHGKGTSVTGIGDFWVGQWENGARNGLGSWHELTGKAHFGAYAYGCARARACMRVSINRFLVLCCSFESCLFSWFPLFRWLFVSPFVCTCGRVSNIDTRPE